MRTLKFGMVGSDVLAVGRALKAADYSGFTAKSRLYGVGKRRAVRDFQRDHGLAADGIYGPATHGKLAAYFDADAWELWPPLLLPRTFRADHETAGLPGYPAIDVFAPGGTRVACDFSGTVRRLSGHPPTPTVAPGGPYGLTVYVRDDRGNDFFLTHFGTRRVSAGQEVVARATILGTVADYAKATHGVTPSHIHEGKRAA